MAAGHGTVAGGLSVDSQQRPHAGMRTPELTPTNPFPSSHGWRNRALRAIWGAVWLVLFRPTPKLMHGWRRFLLRLFGARIGRGAVVHASVRVWAPWNLTMGDHSCLAPFVDCYCVAPITLDPYAAVSQYSFLCAATHDYSSLARPLVVAPIRIDTHAWVCADVFIGPGVRIGEGAVVGARSAIFRNVQPWTVVAGNPATLIKQRKLTK